MTSWLRSWARSNKIAVIVGIWITFALAGLAAALFPILFVAYAAIFAISVITFIIYVFIDVFTE